MTTMRQVITLSLALGVTLVALQPLHAQNSRGNLEAGLGRLAEMVKAAKR